MNIRQPKIPAGVAVGEARVIEAEQMQQRGVDVVIVHLSLIHI